MATTSELKTASSCYSSTTFSPEAKALADLTATVHRILKRYLPWVLIPLGIIITRFTWEVAMMTGATFTDIAPDVSWGPRGYAITYRDAEKRSEKRVRLDGTVLPEAQDSSKGNRTESQGDREKSSSEVLLPQTFTVILDPTDLTATKNITLALTTKSLGPNVLTITSNPASPAEVSEQTEIGTLSTSSLFGLRPRVVVEYRSPDGRHLVLRMNSHLYLVDTDRKKAGLIGQGKNVSVRVLNELSFSNSVRYLMYEHERSNVAASVTDF